MGRHINHIVIYNYRLAQELFEEGYDVVSIKPNTKVKGEVVFFFKNERGLVRHLKEMYGIYI